VEPLSLDVLDSALFWLGLMTLKYTGSMTAKTTTIRAMSPTKANNRTRFLPDFSEAALTGSPSSLP
jgi:hypothetical protein